MSGGSLDYIYTRVEDTALAIRSRCSSPIHQAFAIHLAKIAKALHDIEWVLSNDMGEGDDIQAIQAVISPEDILAQTIAAALEAKSNLDDALAAVTKERVRE